VPSSVGQGTNIFAALEIEGHDRCGAIALGPIKRSLEVTFGKHGSSFGRIERRHLCAVQKRPYLKQRSAGRYYSGRTVFAKMHIRRASTEQSVNCANTCFALD